MDRGWCKYSAARLFRMLASDVVMPYQQSNDQYQEQPVCKIEATPALSPSTCCACPIPITTSLRAVVLCPYRWVSQSMHRGVLSSVQCTQY